MNFRHILAQTRNLLTMVVVLLSAVTAWADDISVTYDIGYTGGTFDRTGFITRADNSSLTFTWARGVGVVWRADYAYGVDDEYDITFTPNKELNSHDKIFTTEHNTTFTVTTAAENNYVIKSVVFMDGSNVETGSKSFNARKSGSVTVAAEKDIVHVTVTLATITGSCGENATWTMTDEDGNGTYETLTISGAGAITSSPWATDFAATINRVNIGSADLTISGNPFGTLGAGAVIVVPTLAYAVNYSSAAYASKLRVPLGSYIFAIDGTADDAAYAITSETDLRNLSAAVDATKNVSVGKTFRQTAPIDLSSGGDFYPIGKIGGDYSFQGTYDGQGNAISGLSISKEWGNIGFFGRIAGATVRNVVLVSPTVTATTTDNSIDTDLGSLIGFCGRDGTNTVENNIVVSPTVSSSVSGRYIHLGAIIGNIYYNNTTVRNSFYYDNSHDYASIGTNDGGHLTNVGRARKVTFGDGVAAPATVPATEGFTYDIDGDDKVDYFYREGLDLTISPEESDNVFTVVNFDVEGVSATIVDNGNGARFTVPASDVTVSAAVAKIILASGAVKVFEDQNGRYAEIDGNYGGDGEIIIPQDIKVNSVTFDREFPISDGYSTVVFPFEVNTSQMTGVDSVLVFAKMVKDKNGNLAVGMRVAWHKGKEPVVLAANIPYMLKMNASTIGIADKVTLKRTKEPVTPSEVSDGWEFRGTYEYKQWSEGDEDVCRVYGYAATSTEDVSAGEFVKFIAGARIRPLRAYLINTNKTCATSPKNAPLPASADGGYAVKNAMTPDDVLPEHMNVVIIGDDEEHTTVIGRINTRTGEFTGIGSGKRFDLKGRPVRGSSNARGAYYNKNLKKYKGMSYAK